MPTDFYEFWGGSFVKRTSFKRGPVDFPVVLYDIPIFLRVGHIVLMSDSFDAKSAEQTRLQPMYLKIGLNCNLEVEVMTCEARGKIAFSDKLLFDFQSTEKQVEF